MVCSASSHWGETAQRLNLNPDDPGSNLLRATWFYPQARTLLNGPVWWECSVCRDLTTIHTLRLGWIARPSPPNCKNEYLVLTLGKEAAAQAVVGSIVRTFRRSKKSEVGR